MKHKLLIIVFLSLFSLGQVHAAWYSSGPKISKDNSDVWHIFRDSHGHFTENTPENRAFIESAAESPFYKVGSSNFGYDIYLRTMPSGIQAWAEVRNGVIVNGGYNTFPKQWVPDDSYRGGRFVTPKFSIHNPNDSTFRGALTVNNLVSRNGFLNHLSPSHWGTREVVQGIEGKYGRIINLFETPDKKGRHRFLLPIQEVNEEEALQILREVAQGIYVYEAVPIFSLHFNRDKDQYPVLFPHYRKTLIGEAIAMLDYWMKSAVNGRYFDPEFIYAWEINHNMSYSHLIKKSHSFHEYCDKLGISYRSFFDILDDLNENSDVKISNHEKLTANFRIVDFQNHIWKWGKVISFEPSIKIDYSIGLAKNQSQENELLKVVCNQMCSELTRVLPQMPDLRKYFEILHLANFFSYYCQTMKEQGLIPLLSRDLKKHQIEYRGCPNLFPPIPITMEDIVEIQFTNFLKFLEATSSFRLNQLAGTDSKKGGEIFHLAMQSYLENYDQNLLEFSIAVFECCKEKYSKTKSNFDQFFQIIGIKEGSDCSERYQAFFDRIDSLIKDLEGDEEKEMRMLRKQVTEWFLDPCAYVFKNSGMKLSTANGSFFPINHCFSDDVQFAGGCGFPIHHDMIAEEKPELLQMAHKEIEISYSEMEIEEWDDPREVAKGYLFPPLPDHPINDSVLTLLLAIRDEDISLFDERKRDLWMWEWNYCDSLGCSLVHHAASAKTDYFLTHMTSKWANIEQVDRRGWTPLHYAAAYGSIECIRHLMAIQPDLLERKGDDGETALFVATQYGQQEVASTLLCLGANPNFKIRMGLNALMWSILSKKETISELFLNCPKIDLSDQMTTGETVLELAIQCQSIRVLKKLLDSPIDVNRYHRGMTPLHLATVLKWDEGIDLLSNHPLVDVDLLTSDGRSFYELGEAYKH